MKYSRIQFSYFMLPRTLQKLMLIAAFCAPAAAYPAFCRLHSMDLANHTVAVSCRLDAGLDRGEVEFRFRDSYAGMKGLARRIYNFSGANAEEKSTSTLTVVQSASGVYKLRLGGSREIRVDYRVSLSEIPDAVADPGRYALLSSLGTETAVFIPQDLLPELGGELPVVRLRIDPPANWNVATTERQQLGVYEVQDFGKAVFIAGQLRRNLLNVDRSQVDLATAGKLNISDLQLGLTTGSLLREQMKMMSETRRGKFLVAVLPFPVPVSGLRSAALTLGRSVVMLVNSDADRERTTRLFQRHMSHELLHFYLPESLKIQENFDWFWEGFVRYQGLVTLNRLGLLSSRDLLDEMEKEFSAYRSNRLSNSISLIAASPDKFSNGATYDLVYHKGTLVAWLYDMELHSQSAGKQGLSEVMAGLYKTYGYSGEPVGNREVLSALRKAGRFDRFLQDYVEGTRAIDLAELTKGYGLEVNKVANSTRISIAPKLSVRQRQALAQLVQPEAK